MPNISDFLYSVGFEVIFLLFILWCDTCEYRANKRVQRKQKRQQHGSVVKGTGTVIHGPQSLTKIENAYSWISQAVVMLIGFSVFWMETNPIITVLALVLNSLFLRFAVKDNDCFIEVVKRVHNWFEGKT